MNSPFMLVFVFCLCFASRKIVLEHNPINEGWILIILVLLKKARVISAVEYTTAGQHDGIANRGLRMQ